MQCGKINKKELQKWTSDLTDYYKHKDAFVEKGRGLSPLPTSLVWPCQSCLKH